MVIKTDTIKTFEAFDNDKIHIELKKKSDLILLNLIELKSELNLIGKQFLTMKEEREALFLETKGQTLPAEFFIKKEALFKYKKRSCQ